MGIEPAELRLRNYIPDDAYPVKTRTGVDLEALVAPKCMTRLLELIDLPKLRAEHTALRAQRIFRGIGFASFVETNRNECTVRPCIFESKRRRTASR